MTSVEGHVDDALRSMLAELRLDGMIRDDTVALLVELVGRQQDEIGELRDLVLQQAEVLEGLLAARESDYVYALTARRIRDARLPRSRVEASLMWMYAQWRKHGDDEQAYEPMPVAAIEAADRRAAHDSGAPTARPAPLTPSRRRTQRWEVSG